MGNAKELRLSICADILEMMNKNGDLPLTTIFAVSKMMIEYFRAEGYVDDLREDGYKWRPTRDYFVNNMSEIRAYMRKQREKYFEFLRPEGDFKGQWKFVSEKEFKSIMEREHSDVGTRTETYNERLDDGKEKWEELKELPNIKKVPPLLTDNNN